MPTKYLNEKWKEYTFPEKLKNRYAVSNYGRIMRFEKKFSDGKILKGTIIDGYKVFRYKKQNTKGKMIARHFFVHKMVAEKFLSKPRKGQTKVIHLDHKRSNNKANNLSWANNKELIAHTSKSPLVKAARKKLIEYNRQLDGHKLTLAKAKRLKKILLNPRRKVLIKTLAAQYGISEMQAYRIKSGENWGHVKV